MKEGKKGINQILAEMADDMVITRNCTFLWGEEELPECLMKTEEKKQEEC